jgi:hypothetical protein
MQPLCWSQLCYHETSLVLDWTAQLPGMVKPGNTKWGSITVPLTSCLTGLESAVWQLTILFLFAKQTNPNKSNRRSMVQWYSPFSIPWLSPILGRSGCVCPPQHLDGSWWQYCADSLPNSRELCLAVQASGNPLFKFCYY